MNQVREHPRTKEGYFWCNQIVVHGLAIKKIVLLGLCIHIFQMV